MTTTEQIARDIAAWDDGWTYRVERTEAGMIVRLRQAYRADIDGETGMHIDIEIKIIAEPNWSAVYVTTEIGSPENDRASRLVGTNVRNEPVRKALDYITAELDRIEQRMEVEAA